MNQNISPLVQAPIQNLPPLMQQQLFDNKRPGLNNQVKLNESAINKGHEYRNHFQKPASNQGHLFNNQSKMHSDHINKNQTQHSGNYGQLPPKIGPLLGNHQPNSGYHPPQLINQTKLPENRFVGNYSQPFENQKVVSNQFVKSYEHVQVNSGQHLPSEGQMFGNQNQPFSKSTNQNVLNNNHETFEDQRGVHVFQESTNGVQRQIPGNQMYKNQGQTPAAQGQKAGSPGGSWVSRQLSDNRDHMSGIPRQMHDNQGKIMANQGKIMANQGEMPSNHKQISNNQVQISNQRYLSDNQKSSAVNLGKLSNTQRQIADNQRQSFGNQPPMFGNQGQVIDNLKQPMLNKHGRVASNQNQFHDTQKQLSGNQQKAIGIQGSLSGNNGNFPGNHMQVSGNQRQLEFQGNPPLNHVSEKEKILSGNQGRMLPSRQMSPIHGKKLPKSEEMPKNYVQSNENQTNFPQNQGETFRNQEERFVNEHQQTDKDFIGDNQSKVSGNKNDAARPLANNTSGIIIRAANEYRGAKCKFFPRCKMGKECKFEHPICATSVKYVQKSFTVFLTSLYFIS